MPLWLLKLLPYGAAALALAGAVWFINHLGYERAKTQDAAIEAKLDAQEAKLDADLATKVGDLEGKMQGQMNTLNTDLGNRINNIHSDYSTVIQPTLTKEIASDPKLSDPNNALPDSVWNSLNAARRLSASTDPAGTGPTDLTTVPTRSPAGGQAGQHPGGG